MQADFRVFFFATVIILLLLLCFIDIPYLVVVVFQFMC